MYDYIVVGGGIGGLSIASLLSKAGFKIALFEKRNILGGRASYIEREGFIVDYGIHLIRFGEHGVIPKLMRELDYYIEVLRLGDSFLYDERGSYYLPVNMEGIMKTSYLNDDEKSETLNTLLELIKLSPKQYLSSSIEDYLKDKKLSDKVKNIIRILSGMLLVIPDLERASLGELLDLIKKAVECGVGAGYPRGGWKTIIEILRTAVIDNGGDLFVGKRVDKILFHEDRVIGVESADNDRIEGEVIVSIPPDEFKRISPDKLIEKLGRRYFEVAPTTGVSIDIALNRELYDLHGMIVVDKPFILGLATSGVDKSVAPSDKQLMTFLLPIPYEEFKRSKTKYMERLEKVIYSLFPEIKGNISWIRKVYLPIVDGAAPYYNQSRLDRIPVETSIKGIYFVSDWVSAPGAGSDIAVNAALTLYMKLI